VRGTRTARDIGGHAFVTFSSSATDILLFPSTRVVRLMGQHVADINLVSIIMTRGDESNFVTCDIEHREFPNLTGVRKDFAQLREIQKPNPYA
jgi:hypothetical protein